MNESLLSQNPVGPPTSFVKSKEELEQSIPQQSYLVKLQSGQGHTSVFCFLFAGGFQVEFFTFASLAPMIDRNYSFYGVIAQGTDGVSKPHGSVEEMAAAYIKEIRTVQPKGPYFIIGECFSAPVAYETARQLQAGGERIALLAFLDAREKIRRSLSRYLGKRLGGRVRYHIGSLNESWTRSHLKRDIPFHLRELGRLEGDKRIRYFLNKIRRALAVTSGALRSKMTSHSQPAIVGRNQVEVSKSKHLERAADEYGLAVRRYEPRAYGGRITLIASEEWYNADPTLGWVTVGGLEVHTIPGRHDNYLRNHRQMVADVLKTCIEKAEKEAAHEYS